MLVWTPNVITLWEALLTVLQFGLLLLHAYAQDMCWPYLSPPIERSERPVEWVPEETAPCRDGNRAYDEYQKLPDTDLAESSKHVSTKITDEDNLLSIWKQQFVDAFMLESPESRKTNTTCLRLAKHKSLHHIAYTALAAGTSWPDLMASKIADERQITADSAIANITCSNSVNIYIGISVPWLIDTLYNFFAHNEPLRIDSAGGLSFSLLVFFATSVGCIGVLVLLLVQS